MPPEGTPHDPGKYAGSEDPWGTYGSAIDDGRDRSRTPGKKGKGAKSREGSDAGSQKGTRKGKPT
eukprot:3753889-Heterocapsa_arctica.AAC.1